VTQTAAHHTRRSWCNDDDGFLLNTRRVWAGVESIATDEAQWSPQGKAALATDVAGCSRLVEADEEGALGRLKALRAEVIDPKIAGHRSSVRRKLSLLCIVSLNGGRIAAPGGYQAQLLPPLHAVRQDGLLRRIHRAARRRGAQGRPFLLWLVPGTA
jgi:hypothetical protein